MKLFHKWLLLLAAVTLMALAPFTWADDTELYSSQVTEIKSTDRPNILFVMDRSGSMSYYDYYKTGDKECVKGTKNRMEQLRSALLALLDEVTNVNVGIMTFTGDANSAMEFPMAYIDDKLDNVPGESGDDNPLGFVNTKLAAYDDDAEEGVDSKEMDLGGHELELTSRTGTDMTPGLTVEAQIKTKKDDAREIMGGGNETGAVYSDNNSWLGLGGSSFGKFITGLRFQDLNIPANAKILSAYLVFTAAETTASATPINIKVTGVTKANPVDFENKNKGTCTANGCISSTTTYPETTLSATWAAIPPWQKNEVYYSADIGPVIQEIVKSSWSPGNALALKLERTDWDLAQGNYPVDDKRSFYSFDASPTNAVRIQITYAATEAEGGIAGAGVSAQDKIVTEQRIKQTGNDAYEFLGGGIGNAAIPVGNVVTNSFLVLGGGKRFNNGLFRGYVLSGFRFTDLDIPNTATIVNARLELVKKGNLSEDTYDSRELTVNIRAENNTTSAVFNGGAWTGTKTTNLSPRAKTNAAVSWDVPVVGSGNTLTSPNLAQVVKEVINTSSWQRNSNALTLLIDHLSGDGTRWVYDFDENSSKAAKLTIEWVVPRNAEAQMVGVRFQDVQIPQGATITNAYLQFTAAQDHAAAAGLKIAGESAGNSATFGVNKGNLSSRSKTTEEVIWNATPWVTDTIYDTPSLTSVVQEVVNRTDWCGGNAMAFFLRANTGDPLRIAQSYDMNSEKAPRLIVEFDPKSVAPTACINQTLTIQIKKAVDDGEEFTIRGGSEDGGVSTSSDTLEMTTDGNKGSETVRVVGLRFPEIPIRQGTKILSAELILTAKESNNYKVFLDEPVKVSIWGNKNENAPALGSISTSYEFSQKRTRTSASVEWSIAKDNLTPWVKNVQYRTPDLTAVVQEIINQTGWKPYNALAFFIDGHGPRKITAFEANPAQAAILKIKVEGMLGSGDSFGYSKPVRNRLKEVVSSFQSGSSTPLPNAIYEAGMYYTGGAVTFGKSRDGNNVRMVSHAGSFTGGEVIWPTGCSAGNLYDTDCKTQYISGTPVYTKPTATSCQPNFIVFLTDGIATANSATSQIKTFAQKTACTLTIPSHLLDPLSQRTGAKLTSSESCGADMVEALNKTDLNPDLPGSQNIITYTIGFAMGPGYTDTSCSEDTAQTKENMRAMEYLKFWAELGKGKFVGVGNEAELLAAFRQIIASIRTTSTSFAAPTLSVNTYNQLFHNDNVILSLFKPDRKAMWDGNIKKFKLQAKACEEDDANCTLGQLLDKTGQPAVGPDGKLMPSASSLWNNSVTPEGLPVADGGNVSLGGAGSMIPAPDVRKIYSNVVSGDLTATGNTVAVENTGITKELLDVGSTSDRERVLHWIRGWANREAGEQRTWKMADSLHSSPGLIEFNNRAWLYSASNDGSIRMIDANTGAEQWVFIPKELLKTQKTLMDNPSGDRTYGIDGTPTFLTSKDSVKMFVGMRRGGRSIYALDVTPHSGGAHKPQLLWQIDGGSGNFGELGQTWSRLLPVRVEGRSGVMLLFGGGYDPETQDKTDASNGFGPAKQGRAIYMVDTQGNLVWWAGPPGSGANLELRGMEYSIPSDLMPVDMNNNGEVDRIYVGDTGGQVWRIDLNKGGSRGVGGILAKLSTANGENRHRIFYPPEVVELTDTIYASQASTNYDLVLVSTGYRPNPLGTDLQDQLFAIRDRAVAGLEDDGTGNAKTTTTFKTLEMKNSTDEDDFYNATANLLQDGDENAKKVEIEEIQGSYGWYINLDKGVGEKALAGPLVLKGVAYFTTFIPPGQAQMTECSTGEGYGRLYALDILTGGAANDFNKSNNTDGKEVNDITDRSTNLGEGIPSSPMAVFFKDGVSVLVDQQAFDPEISLPRRQIFWYNE